MIRGHGFTTLEALVVVAIITILLVFAGVRPDAAKSLDDATRQNLAAQGRLYLHATARLQRLGYVGRARQAGGAIRALAPEPLPDAAIEHLAGVARARDFPADRALPPEHGVFSFDSSSAGAVVTLTLGGLAGDLGAAAPADVESRRLGDGSWSWIWRSTPGVPGRARRVTERLYRR